MIKHVLVIVCAVCVGCSVFGASVRPENFKWKETNKAILTNQLNWARSDAAKPHQVLWRSRLAAQIALADNPDIKTYSEYKIIVSNAINQELTDQEKSKFKLEARIPGILYSYMLNVDRFKSLIPGLLQDSSVINNAEVAKAIFINSKAIVYIKQDSNLFKSTFLSCIQTNVAHANKTKNKQAFIDRINKALTRFEEELPNKVISTEEAMECLKIAKLAVYPKINESDLWKPAAVKIELLMKALQ